MMLSFTEMLNINDKDWQAHRGVGVAYMMKSLKNKDDTLKAKAIKHWVKSSDLTPTISDREAILKLIRKYSIR